MPEKMANNKPVPVKAEEVALTLVAQQICDLIVAGFRLPDIAGRLSLTRAEVRRHLVEVNRRVIENGLLKRDHLRAQVYTDYDHLLAELEDAWEESKPKPLPEGVDLETQIELVRAEAGGRKNYTAGDARYLQLALDILKQKRAMLGLDAPKRIEMPGLPAPGEQGEDYVIQLHERFATIQRNMRQRQPAQPGPTTSESPAPTPVEQAPASDPDTSAAGVEGSESPLPVPVREEEPQ